MALRAVAATIRGVGTLQSVSPVAGAATFARRSLSSRCVVSVAVANNRAHTSALGCTGVGEVFSLSKSLARPQITASTRWASTGTPNNDNPLDSINNGSLDATASGGPVSEEGSTDFAAEDQNDLSAIANAENDEVSYHDSQGHTKWTKTPNTRKAPSNAEVLTAEVPMDFTPEKMQRSLLKTLELEEMYHRTKQRELPYFVPGSVLRVHYQEARSRTAVRKIVGRCTSKVSRGLGSNFTIRNVLEGVPFEMKFYVHQPLLLKVEVLELVRRRRSKLYYLRGRPDKQSFLSQNYQPVVKHKKKKGTVSSKIPVDKAK